MRKACLYFYDGYCLFSKRLFIHLLLILELFAALLALNLTVSTVQELYADVNMLRRADQNAVFVMPMHNPALSPDENPDLSQIQGTYTVGEGYRVALYASFPIRSTTLYTAPLVDGMKIPLAKGDWNAGVLLKDGTSYYPVIVSREGPVYLGDTFLATTDQEPIGCYVAGVLDDRKRYIALSSSSSAASTQQVIGVCDEGLSVFCNEAYVPRSLFDNIVPMNNKVLIFENLSEEQKMANATLLRNQGFRFGVDEIIENSLVIIRDQARYFFPLSFCVLLVGVVGLLSVSALSLYQNREYFRTVLLCGGRRRDCMAIALCRDFVTTLIVAGLLCITWLGSWVLGKAPALSWWNLLLTGAVLLVVLLLNSLIPFSFFRRAQAKTLLLSEGDTERHD